jgi:hypothetical protein
MRLPRVRIMVRWILVGVALVEVAAGFAVVRRRSDDFRDRARFHATETGLFLARARLWEDGPNVGCTDIPPDASPEECAQGARRCRLRAAYQAALSRKYERAATHPWLPIAADPPAPE